MERVEQDEVGDDEHRAHGEDADEHPTPQRHQGTRSV
jgi:hypothetical protein